jgi:O-antigen/teichoic acid export membrane protein
MKKSLSEIILPLIPGKLREPLAALSPGSLSGRIARVSFWALSGSVISKGFLLVSTILVARILGKSLYGEFGIILSTINMFAVFAGFGLGITSTKYVAELRESNPEMAGKIIFSSNLFAFIFGLFFTLAFILMSHVISDEMINAPYLDRKMRVGAILLFFNAINGAQAGALAGFEDFKSIARINVFAGLISLPAQVILTHFYGIEGALTGLAVAYFCQWILNYYALRKTAARFNVRIKRGSLVRAFSYIWKFSLPAVLGGIIVSVTMWTGNVFLVSNQNGFNEMAIFNAAGQWQNIVLFIPMAISQISLPLFSNTKNDRHKFTRIIKYNVLINIVICVILAAVFSLFSKPIMHSYGPGFREGTTVLIVLSLTAVLISVNSVIGQVIAGLGKMWVGMAVNCIWAFTYLVLAKVFVSEGDGAIGLAKAMFFSYIVHTIIVTLLSLFFMNRSYHPKSDTQPS